MSFLSPQDLLGWCAFAFTASGTVCLWPRVNGPNLDRLGWRLRFVGDMMWLCWSWWLGYPSAIVNELTFMTIDLFGVWKSGHSR